MDKNKTDTLGYKIGLIAGKTLAAVVVSCVAALAVALTIRFIIWLF